MPKSFIVSWIILIILSMIWGGSFMPAKIALTSFSPMAITALRVFIATVILLVIMLIRRDKFPNFKGTTNKRIWINIIVMGILSTAIPFTLLNWAQLRVGSGFAGITMAIGPFFTLILAHFLLSNERINTRRFIGIIIGFIGVFILISPSKLIINPENTMETLAQIACIGAAFSYSLGAIVTRLCPPIPTLPYSTAGLFISTIAIIPLVIYFEGIPTSIQVIPLINVVYLGIIPTALATIMLVYLIKIAGPNFLSLANYLIPIWAVAFGVIFMKEDLPPRFIIALSLILLGLVISQLFQLKRIFTRKEAN